MEDFFFYIVSRRGADNNAWIKLIVSLAEARFDTWRHRRRKDKENRQLRIKMQNAGRDLARGALLSGPEHVHLGVCVCIVRDGLQMMLPLGLQYTCLQLWVCLKIETKLLS